MARTLSHGKSWTPMEEAKLRELYATTKSERLADIFGRSKKAVNRSAKVLGLQKAIGHGGKVAWTKALDRELRRLYPDTHSDELARKLNVSVLALYQSAQKLGVRKSASYIERKRYEERKRLSAAGVAHRYPKGHAPQNKGTRRPGWFSGRMRETQFKKGQRSGVAAKNWRPIGTILADAGGFLRIKVREGVKGEPYGFGNVKIWPLLNRHIWQQQNGPIPAGHIVAFKDGNRKNCAIGNLELRTRAENMLRNTVHNLPPELTRVIQLAGALKRKIRNREEKLNGKEHSAGPAGPSLRDVGGAL